MADYYPLIARAVEGLPEQSRDQRHAVYERARTALIAKLRNLNPPLSEAEIQQEGRSLDEAITRVEAEYAAARAREGAVMAILRAFGPRAEVVRAFLALADATLYGPAALGRREREVLALATS